MGPEFQQAVAALEVERQHSNAMLKQSHQLRRSYGTPAPSPIFWNTLPDGVGSRGHGKESPALNGIRLKDLLEKEMIIRVLLAQRDDHYLLIRQLSLVDDQLFDRGLRRMSQNVKDTLHGRVETQNRNT